MNNDLVEGISKQVTGAVKRIVGKLIGDSKMAADGAAEETSGDAQMAATVDSGQVMGIDVDRIKGIAHQLEGSIKQGLGSLMADADLRQSGIAERKAGQAQNTLGGARDTAREAMEKGQ